MCTLSPNIIYYLLPSWVGGKGLSQMSFYYQNFSFPSILDSNDGRWNVSTYASGVAVTAYNCSTNTVSGLLTLELYGSGNLTYKAGSTSNSFDLVQPGIQLKGAPGLGGNIIRNPSLKFFYSVALRITDNLVDREIVMWNPDMLTQLDIKFEPCYIQQYYVEPGLTFDKLISSYASDNITVPFRTSFPPFSLLSCLS